MKNLVFLLMLLGAVSGFGQGFWKNNGSAPGNTIENLVQTPDGTLISGGLMDYNTGKLADIISSTDNGGTWKTTALNFTSSKAYQYLTIGQNGTLLMLETDEYGWKWPLFNKIWKSNDMGQSWQLFADSTNINSICETANGTLFANRSTATSNQFEIAKSTDFGQNWTTVLGQIADSGVGIDDFGNLGVGDYPKGLVSQDNGISWKTVNYNQGRLILPSGKYLYFYGYLFRGVLNTNTEEKLVFEPDSIASQVYLRNLYRLPSGRIILNVETYSPDLQRNYYSDNEGTTWHFMGSNNAPQFVNQKPLADGSVLLQNFARSFDNMQTWTNGGAAFRKGYFYKTVSGKSSGEVFGLSSTGLFHTIDNGQNWEFLNDEPFKSGNFEGYWDFTLEKGKNPILLAPDAIFYSKNGGTSFKNIAPSGFSTTFYAALDGYFAPRIHYDSVGKNLFVHDKNAVYRSSNLGGSWSKVPSLGDRHLMDFYAAPGGKLFAIAMPALQNSWPTQTPAELWVSTDGGKTWAHDPEGDTYNDITADRNGKIYLTKRDKHWNGDYFLTSADNGQNWLQHDAKVVMGYLCFNSANDMIASDSGQIYRSFDGGNNWFNLPRPVKTSYGLRIGSLFNNENDQIYLSGYSRFTDSTFFRSAEPVHAGAYLTGTLYKSNDTLCQTPDLQIPLPGWVITANGADEWYASTDDDGAYQFYMDVGPYNLTVNPQISPLWQNCPDSTLVYLPTNDTTIHRDLQETALADCPYMTVDAWAWLHRCFEGYLYFQYCNVGTLPTDSAWLEIDLDPFLTLTDTAHNWLPLGQNRFRLFLGAVDIGGCGSLSASVFTDCDSTVSGQVHCIEAHVTPDNLCIVDTLWSGAEIMARATCAGDSVRFEVVNMTNVATQPLDYVIIEDDVILLQSQTSYPPNSVTSFTVAASDFLRFESEQEPNHPFSTMVAAWQAGCDTMGGWTWINQFFTDNGFPSRDVECVANVGSYDPNEKIGTPLGFGAEHFIRPETDIEYVVNFQNTGTAAAQNVVVRDTLSAFLDPGSLRMGASSHPMAWSVDGHGALSVHFKGINLPDSTANEAASHGFFSFKIGQKPGLPLGTLIENRAAIYFDFNEAVLTNTTFHRLEMDFLKTKDLPPAPGSHPSVKISPNPVGESALFGFENLPIGKRHFELVSPLGMVLRSEFFSGQKFVFDRKGLPAGAYFFSVSTADNGRALGGKLILR